MDWGGLDICGSVPHQLKQARWRRVLDNSAEKRGEIIRLLEQTFALADELGDGNTGYPIERALDEARSRRFRLMGWLDREPFPCAI